MIYASIIVEALRVRPMLVFWLVALAQALLWFLVPALFYAAPPGLLAQTIAIGHEWQFGTRFGPPLAYWLAELAFDSTGGRMLGLYLLSQLCVLATLASLMALGRRIVGPQQSVLSVLLMGGIFAASIPTPEFGPFVLAMPLWALALLSLWRAVGEGHRGSWLVLALTLGLLLLTSYFAVVLFALVDLYLVGTQRGRNSLRTFGPWLCLLIVLFIIAPYAAWLSWNRPLLQPILAAVHPLAPTDAALVWLRILGDVILAQAGAVLLVALASGWPFARKELVPRVNRVDVPPSGPAFIGFFAIATPLGASMAAVVFLPHPRLVEAAPILILTGLGVIVAAGASIRLHRQYILAYAWIALLLAPPVMVALGASALPRLLPIDVRVAQPAAHLGEFFATVFKRRTGEPLTIVTGDPRLAALVAVMAPSRPHLFIDRARTPWVTPDDIKGHGAVVLWPAHDIPGTPPAPIKAQFPHLVLEVPQVFARTLQGFGPPLRVGWAMIRPDVK